MAVEAKKKLGGKTSDFAIGVISENPAMIMNEDSEGQAIALKGLVRSNWSCSKRTAVYAWADGEAHYCKQWIGWSSIRKYRTRRKIIQCVLKV